MTLPNALTQKPCDVEFRREMVCPFCGHRTEIYHIGAVHCSSHKLDDGSYWPAVRMVPVVGNVNEGERR